MKRTIFPLLFAPLLTVACGGQVNQSADDKSIQDEESVMPGDSAYYGLACEGCTDSILVLLPYTGDNPDTFDILDAFLNRKVMGRPRIGDQMVVIRDTVRHTQASLVINLSRLKGTWCYQVMPRLRRRRVVDSVSQPLPSIPDSLLRRWLQPREYGFEIRRDNAVVSIGNNRSKANEQQSPVVYPEARRYREWHIFNGRLILSESHRDPNGMHQISRNDTAEIILLRNDSLRLRFSGFEQGYYRRNKK